MNTLKDPIRFAAAGIALALLGFTTDSAYAGILYSNGFEPTDSGTRDFYDSTTNVEGANIAIVASGGGALGLTAASGSHYAEITNTDDAYSIANSLPSGYGQSVYTDYGPRPPAAASSPAAHSTNRPHTTSIRIGRPRRRPIHPPSGLTPRHLLTPAIWTNPISKSAFLEMEQCRWLVLSATLAATGRSQRLPPLDGTPSKRPLRTPAGSSATTFRSSIRQATRSAASTGLQPSRLLPSPAPITAIGQPYGKMASAQPLGRTKTACLNVLGIDDVQVGTVPEPASFSLLGIGALALLRRRRRA